MEINEIKNHVKVDDVLICMIDEWNDGRKEAYDGHVQFINKNGVDVLYLSGYRSRNDFVPWEDVIAKVDLKMPRVSVANGTFEGHFQVFQEDKPNEEVLVIDELWPKDVSWPGLNMTVSGPHPEENIMIFTKEDFDREYVGNYEKPEVDFVAPGKSKHKKGKR